MSAICESVRGIIETRRLTGWRGLPPECGPEALFGVPLGEGWGELPLGKTFEPARSRLLDIEGYYRPMAYVRGHSVVLFDAMNPVLGETWEALAADLGQPDAIQSWVHGAITMPDGLRIYADKGVTIFLNPQNDFVIHASLYTPTTVEEYLARLWIDRAKRVVRK